jgi:hypothetical protein
MTFEKAKIAQAAHYDAVRLASQTLQRLRGEEQGVMGLTPDHIKFSPEYRAAKLEYDRQHELLRQFNRWMVTERRAKRLAKSA